MDELTTLDADRLRLRMLKTLKPATVKATPTMLNRIINLGVKRGLREAPSPSRFRIEMPKVCNGKTEDLTPEQLRSLLKAIKEDDHPHAGPMMLAARYTGMRRS